MSARSGLVGNNHPGPTWGHFRRCFPWTGKNAKKCVYIYIYYIFIYIFIFVVVPRWPYSPGLGKCDYAMMRCKYSANIMHAKAHPNEDAKC